MFGFFCWIIEKQWACLKIKEAEKADAEAEEKIEEEVEAEAVKAEAIAAEAPEA